MKSDDWLKNATKKLEKAGVPSAYLDSLILLEHVLGQDRTSILAHPELKLTEAQLRRLERLLNRRARHEPIAYIRGFSEFYGRQFRVNRRVLEPRPESETMIELLKSLSLPAAPAIADVGTGSGCLGITAALEIADALVDLFDIDSNALAVAKHNAVMHELHLRVYKRDLLSRPPKDYSVILANLPYIPNDWQINPSAMAEPKIAIFGGLDGLTVYRRLFWQVGRLPVKPQYILTEALPPQHSTLAQIAEQEAGCSLVNSQDFIQVFKI